MATPMIMAKAMLDTKVQERNSSSGMIGSLARLSTRTKSAARTTTATSSPMPVLEVQPRSGPAQLR
jgi:hypothetical protein